MISLAVLYAVLDAPFLFAVQIIVYTGAILMLFLFVLMLVGVDASDSVVETIRGQRVLATVVGLVFGADRWCSASRQVSLGTVAGLDEANAGRQRPGRSPSILFTRYVFAFEVDQRAADHRRARRDGARAPRAARPRSRPRRDLAAQRMRDYADHGMHLGPLPPPGVFARHNAVDTPALLPDGTAVGGVDLAGARRPRHGPLGARAGRRPPRRRASARRRPPTTGPHRAPTAHRGGADA